MSAASVQPTVPSSVETTPTDAVVASPSGAEASANAVRKPASAAAWIDTSSKNCLKQTAEEASLLIAVLFNTPTVGFYHIQQHIQQRVPKMIEEGKTMGAKQTEDYQGLGKDVTMAAESAKGIVGARVTMRRFANRLMHQLQL